MSVISKMNERMDEMEKKIASLEKQLLAKTKDKASKEVKASKEKGEASKEKGKGPKEWNVFVAATRKEMAAAKGVFMEKAEGEKEVKKALAAFNKASSAVGASYHAAMKEASRRKDELEGRDHSVKEAKKAKAKAKAAKAKPEESEAEESESEAEEGGGAYNHSEQRKELAKEIAELNMIIKNISGTDYILDKGNNEVFFIEDNNSMGDHAGVYDVKTGKIDFKA